MTKSESEFKGVIVGIPFQGSDMDTANSEPANEVSSDNEQILALLKDLHVTHVHRIFKPVEEVPYPSPVIILSFSLPIPYRVT